MFFCTCSSCLCIHRSLTLSSISCTGASISVRGVRSSCEMLMKKRSFISFTSFCLCLSTLSICSSACILFLIQKYLKMNTVIAMNAAANSSSAHHVLYHTGSTVISNSVGVSFHFPSLFAAFTRNRYVPAGRLE